jgi:hypothetical protein
VRVRPALRSTSLVATVVIALTVQAVSASHASAAPPPPRPSSPALSSRQSLPRLANPSRDLPKGYQSSTDRAWSLSGDADGLHVLTATESSSYAWKI